MKVRVTVYLPGQHRLNLRGPPAHVSSATHLRTQRNAIRMQHDIGLLPIRIKRW